MANPFILGNTANTNRQANTLEEFKEYAWDFDRSCFIYDAGGAHKIVSRNEAIKVWVYKTLMTERYRYAAYFDDYGIELERFIGTVPNDGAEVNEFYQYIKDGLLVNPYILEVSNISAEQSGKKIKLTIALTTVYGKSTLGIEV